MVGSAVTAPAEPIPDNRQGGARAIPIAVWVGVAVAVAAITVVGTGTHWQPAPDGLPDPGRLVVDGLPILRAASLLAAGVAVGFLFSGLALDPGAGQRDLGRSGRADLAVAAVAAAIWTVADIGYAVLALADVLGVTLPQLAQPGVFLTYAWDVETTRAYLVSAILAGSLAFGLRGTRSLGGAAGWLVVALAAAGIPALTGHAAGLGGHSLALVSGFFHNITALLWGGTVVALATHAAARAPGMRVQLVRFSAVAVACVGLLGLSGVGSAATRLNSVAQLWTTTYGRMVSAKIVALALALAAAAMIRRRLATGSTSGFPKVLLAEVAAISTAMGVAVVLARSVFPRTPVELPSYGESLIGYPYPPPPTLARVALGWHPDYIWLAGCLLAGGLYLWGVIILHRRGDRWATGRTISWLVGLTSIVWATCAGIAWYAPTSFALHMISHMVLAMFAPVFLVLGAPLMLALRVLPANGASGEARGGGRGPREWLLWALHSPVARVVTHPAYVLVIYTVGLYGLYYSALYGWLMGSHLGHFFMQLHFLAAGYLFYWVVIGIDPAPRRLGYPARLVLLMASLVIHSFFAVPMMMSQAPMVADWYAVVRPPWLVDPAADTRTAGGIAWGFGEIPTLVVALALAVQWARADDREARRSDRRAELDDDAELRAYNTALSELSRSDGSRGEGRGA